jgi:hypothetical protein
MAVERGRQLRRPLLRCYLGQFDALQPLIPFARGKPLLPQVPAGHATKLPADLPLILSPWRALTSPALKKSGTAATMVITTNFNIIASNNFEQTLCSNFLIRPTAVFKLGHRGSKQASIGIDRVEATPCRYPLDEIVKISAIVIDGIECVAARWRSFGRSPEYCDDGAEPQIRSSSCLSPNLWTSGHRERLGAIVDSRHTHKR